MDPKHMNGCLKKFNGHFLLCPNGSHLAQYDDQKIYFKGLISFLRDVDKGTFKKREIV
jgi:proline iminopeptidase